MRLVSVVASTRSPRSTRSLMRSMRSSIWPSVGRTSMVGIDDAGGPDELLHHALRALQLPGAGRGAHVHDLVEVGLELLERQRPVVQRGRQAEAEVDEDLLAGAVVLVHARDLRDGHVALVDDEQPVGREVVEQRPRP